MRRRKRITTEADFDLDFVRNIKHRLRMTLREIEKAEKWLAKAAKFQRSRTAKGTAEEIEAAIQFYQNLQREANRPDGADQVIS